MKTIYCIILCAIIVASCSKSKNNEPSVSDHLATVGLSTDKHYVMAYGGSIKDTFSINSDNTITTYGESFPVIINSYHSYYLNSDILTIITTDKLHTFPKCYYGYPNVYIALKDTCYLYYTKFSSTDSGYRFFSPPSTGNHFDYRVTVY